MKTWGFLDQAPQPLWAAMVRSAGWILASLVLALAACVAVAWLALFVTTPLHGPLGGWAWLAVYWIVAGLVYSGLRHLTRRSSAAAAARAAPVKGTARVEFQRESAATMRQLADWIDRGHAYCVEREYSHVAGRSTVTLTIALGDWPKDIA